jgi:hypothetical protein
MKKLQTKVEIIECDSSSKLEEKINSFILAHINTENYRLKDIIMNTPTSWKYMATIIYEEEVK